MQSKTINFICLRLEDDKVSKLIALHYKRYLATPVCLSMDSAQMQSSVQFSSLKTLAYMLAFIYSIAHVCLSHKFHLFVPFCSYVGRVCCVCVGWTSSWTALNASRNEHVNPFHDHPQSTPFCSLSDLASLPRRACEMPTAKSDAIHTAHHRHGSYFKLIIIYSPPSHLE